MLCTSGFVNDVVFCHNGPWRVALTTCIRKRCAGVSSHTFPTYSPGCATLSDFVIVYDGSKLHTGVGSGSDDDMRDAAIGW